MDPLSVTASIIAVLGAAGAVVKGLKKAKSMIIDAPSELQAFIQEVSDIQQVATDIECILNPRANHNVSSTRVPSLLNISNRILVILNRAEVLIDQKLLASSEPGGKLRYSRKAWVKVGSEIRHLRNELHSLRSNLTTSLAILTTDKMLTSELRLTTINEDLVESERKSEAFRKLVSRMLEEHKRLLLGTKNSNAEDSAELAMSGQNTEHSSSENLDDSSLLPPQHHADCQCLNQLYKTLQTPLFLRSLFGCLFLEYYCSPVFDSSSVDVTCARRLKRSATFSYGFPNWLWSRRLHAMINYKKPTGPELLVRLPRVVANDALVFHYGATGDVAGLGKLFTEGLASPFDEDNDGKTALHRAAFLGNIEACRFLVMAGADVHARSALDVKPMDAAWSRILSRRGTPTNCKALQEIFPDSDGEYLESRKFTIAHKAVIGLTSVKLSSIKDLLSSEGININAQDSGGSTSLAWACQLGDTDSVRILLKCGADTNIGDFRGITPSMRCRTPNCLDLLLRARAKVDTIDLYRQTALVYAAGGGSLENTKLLLEYGADIDAVDEDGESALSVCVQRNIGNIVRYLLDVGARYDIPSNDGKTIVEKALKLCNTSTLDILTEANLQGFDTRSFGFEHAIDASLGEVGVPEEQRDARRKFIESLQLP